MQIVRTLTVARSPEDAFTYLSDCTTTEEWDPGTVRTTRESGTGGVGTRYHNVSTFLGRETELTYHADFTFIGLARAVTPLVAPALRRPGDEAEQGLLKTLG